MSQIIDHPILGVLTDIWEGRVWQTAPHQIGAFGYTARIEINTHGGEPSETQLAAVARLASATQEFKAEVEGYMLEEYRRNIRPAYLATIDDPRFSKRRLSREDLPEITEPSEIWRVIKGFNSITVDEEGDVDLEFVPAFDPNHEFAVRFRAGELYEVMIDG